MPYIKQSRREELKKVYNAMLDAKLLANGDINYLLFLYCKYEIDAGYNNYKNFCGELRQCATEIERRILAEYEDQKIQENGDV